MNRRRHFYAYMVSMLLMMVSLAWTYAGKALYAGGQKNWGAVFIWSSGAILLFLVFPMAIRDSSRANQIEQMQKAEGTTPITSGSPAERKFNRWSSMFSPLLNLPLVGFSLFTSISDPVGTWQFKLTAVVIFLSWVYAAGLYAVEGWRGYQESRAKDLTA